jgi:hypothetical protein
MSGGCLVFACKEKCIKKGFKDFWEIRHAATVVYLKTHLSTSISI